MRNQAVAPFPRADLEPGSASWEDDRCLVLAAKESARNFAPLYARYFDLIYRYCYRRLGHPELAADATSQVFAKAIAGLPAYRDDGHSFRSWLFTIAHNVVIDEVRARRPTTSLDAAGAVAASTPSIEDEVLTAELGSTIRALLTQLSPDQRQVMELRLAGLTTPEIAVTVGRSVGAVKMSQVRAIARLRVAMTGVTEPGKETRDEQR